MISSILSRNAPNPSESRSVLSNGVSPGGLTFRRDPGSVLWRRGRDLLAGQRDGLLCVDRLEGFARFPGFPVGAHGTGRNAPGAGHPLHALRTALALKFPCAKHLAYACGGESE